MVNATIKTESAYSLTINGLSLNQLNILKSFMQNSPHGYIPEEEPEDEWRLREAIHDACLKITAGKCNG